MAKSWCSSVFFLPEEFTRQWVRSSVKRDKMLWKITNDRKYSTGYRQFSCKSAIFTNMLSSWVLWNPKYMPQLQVHIAKFHWYFSLSLSRFRATKLRAQINSLTRSRCDRMNSIQAMLQNYFNFIYVFFQNCIMSYTKYQTWLCG